MTKPGPRPLMLSGDILATGSRVSAEILQAQRVLSEATAALRAAQDELAAARDTRDAARSTAMELDELAATAREQADEAARLYIGAVRGDGDALGSLDAAVKPGGDLLAGLGSMQRVSELTGDVQGLRESADRLDRDADAAEARAEAAWAKVDAVPVERLQQRVDDAEAAVAKARDALAAVRTQLAASSVTVIENLPTDSGQLSDQGWSLPVGGHLTDGFGPRPDKPVAGVNEFHRGTDLAASCGSPVFAATGGTVIEAGRNGSYGNWILIDHGDGVSTGYAHLVDGGILVSVGDRVEAGGLIGAVGSTGASTGCHLHYEVRLGGVAIDAVPFMASRGIRLG
ncbi:M23 family metallopeptidase [Agromyces mediolanus]|uniref:M23 family metallopeptidase n=1 Tax=Agromyces mediolanus TaxID=41986 RepID=UPI003837EC1E